MRKGIYKDTKRGTWYINTKIEVNGELKTATIRGYLTKSEANADYDRAITEWVNNHTAHCEVLLFKDLIEEVKKDRKLTVKHQTFRCDEYIYSKYLSMFNKKLIEEVFNKSSITKWYRSFINDESVSIKRKNKVITRFKDVLKFAYSHLYVDAPTFQICDVILKSIRENVIQKKEKEVWTREEYAKFINAIPEDVIWYPLFIVFGELGCRIGELQGLMWKHFDPERKTIFICQQIIEGTGEGHYIIETPKTSSSIRYNRLTDETVALLVELKTITGGEDNNFIFGTRKPTSRRAIREALYKYSAIAGVKKITPHGIRHSNASWLVETVETIEDVKVISNRLGHSSTQMTLDTYSHVLNSRESSMINVLNHSEIVKEKNRKKNEIS